MNLTKKLDELAAESYRKASKYPADTELLLMIMQQLATQAAMAAIEDSVQPGKSD